MKKTLLVCVTSLLLLTGCQSQDIKKAKVEFDSENYKAVVSLIENYELDQENNNILQISKGCIAFEDKNYEEAINLLKDKDLSGNQKQILEDSYNEFYKKKLDDTENLAQTINEYAKIDINKDALNEYAAEQFTKLYTSDDYETFKKADELVEEIEYEEVKTSFEKTQQDNVSSKIYAFLSGEWVRVDGTNFDGCIVNATIVDGNINAVVTNIDNLKDNHYGLSLNDLKWKNGKIVDSSTISFDDLYVGSGASYNSSIMQIKWNEYRLDLHVSGDDSEYALGGNQVWLKKDYYDQYKDIAKLTDEDFVLKDTNDKDLMDTYKGNLIESIKDGVGTKYAWRSGGYIYSPDLDESKEAVLTTQRDIQIGASMEDVINAYGIGEMNNFNEKIDIYNTLKEDDEVFLAEAKKFRQFITYKKIDKDNKYNSAQMTFYFDETNTLIGFLYAYGDLSELK